MKNYRLYFILLFLPILLIGCVETNILDRVGLVILVGYDVGKEERMATTSAVREVNPEFHSNVEVVTTENSTSKGNRVKTNRKLSKKVVVGQMRVVLFGEELAKDGIHRYVDAHLENPTVSNGLYMAVTEGEVAPLLEYEYQNIEDIGQHIFRLLEQNIEQENMISSTLHEVGRDLYSEGVDLFMPIIKKEEELVELSGIAIFKNDKMVSSIRPEDTFYVKLIGGNYKSGTFETILTKEEIPDDLMKNKPDEIPIAFDALTSEKELKLINKNTPEFDLNITIKTRLTEIYPDVNIGDPKTVKKLEDAISKNLSSEISRVIAYCQSVESDIFAFGDKYRSSVRNSNLTKEKWHELYKNMKVNVKVDLTILRSGVFE
ncbi:Ger(x)C family spore germination protein [Psychrobacillus sp. FSL H8-0487]|uniref:Ger(x)C family spore germination protein n=1 Tax=Psychrobacillus sp. FSL H8-0487 TaxID=2921391 RepID=UPI0030F53A7B